MPKDTSKSPQKPGAYPTPDQLIDLDGLADQSVYDLMKKHLSQQKEQLAGSLATIRERTTSPTDVFLTPSRPPNTGPSSHALPGPPPSPSSIVSKISQQSQRVNDLATKLSQRIVAFENWLNNLPGRVEASFIIGGLGDEERDLGLEISLRRSGKRWALLYYYYEPGDDDPGDLKALTEADLDTKILAVKHFSDLLLAINAAQTKRVMELETSELQFESFARSIGLTDEMEGK